jgi:hypothetical protein
MPKICLIGIDFFVEISAICHNQGMFGGMSIQCRQLCVKLVADFCPALKEHDYWCCVCVHHVGKHDILVLLFSMPTT